MARHLEAYHHPSQLLALLELHSQNMLTFWILPRRYFLYAECHYYICKTTLVVMNLQSSVCLLCASYYFSFSGFSHGIGCSCFWPHWSWSSKISCISCWKGGDYLLNSARLVPFKWVYTFPQRSFDCRMNMHNGLLLVREASLK